MKITIGLCGLLIGTLTACAGPQLAPEDRAAVCTVSPAAPACATGRAWGARRREAHEMALGLAAAQAAHEKQIQLRLDAAEAARGATRNARRTTDHFASFEDARAALRPDENVPSFALALLQDPMGAKGRVGVARAQVVQALAGGRFLLNPCHDVGESCLVLGAVAPAYTGSTDFVDGRMVGVVAEVVGTYHYTTVLGAPATVPEIRIYGMRPWGIP